jgi:hypothetical protein
VYTDSLTKSGLESASTWPILFFANLLDKNTNGLNIFLDGLLTSVFGDSSSYKVAFDRIETLADTDKITVGVDELTALGVYDLLEGTADIEKAELQLLAVALRVVKATLEWVDAYNWETDLNFLKLDWSNSDTFKKQTKDADSQRIAAPQQFLKRSEQRNGGEI